MSRIITFYSYKGGVGRSMALVNVATLLSKWGKKVLMIDWDLEAPGLEFFFKEQLKDVDLSKQKGLLEFLSAKQDKKEMRWQDAVLSFKTSISKEPLSLLISGKTNGNYSDMLRAFNVGKFYEKHDGGRIIEDFRKEILAEYDYILIDSRTGVTDFGGICTVQMPDILVMLFTPTEQGVQGTIKIAKRVVELHKQQPVDRQKLLICPVPSRIDSTAEFQTTRDWLGKIAEGMEFLYRDWVPEPLIGVEFLERIKIPYFPHFSYGEKIPVIEQGTTDPAGLGYAYENLAILVGRGLDSVNEFVDKREIYLEEISGQKTEPTLLLSDKSVKIYISYVDEDENFVSFFIDNLKQNGVPILTNSIRTILPGQSKSKVLNQTLVASDIILLFVSEKYAEQNLELANELFPIPKTSSSKNFNEYPIIITSSKEFIVPILIGDLRKWVIQPLIERHGFTINKHDPEKDINEIIKTLMATIEYIFKEKDKEKFIF